MITPDHPGDPSSSDSAAGTGVGGAQPPGSPARVGAARLRERVLTAGAPWPLIPLAIAVLTFIAFLPVLQAGFVNWDDDHNIVNNRHLRSLGVDQLRWMLTETHAGHYQPLTWLSLAIDYRLWGLDRPGGFHLTNLALHVLAALAVYRLAANLIALDRSGAANHTDPSVRIPAALAALLFAIHPLRVESVAWVTERRDVLGGLFFVLSVLAYVRAVGSTRDGPPHTAWYGGSILLCTLSLLCKAHAVTLVGVLVLLDAYPLRRMSHRPLRALIGKLPFLLLSVVFGIAAIRAQSAAGAMYSLGDYGLSGRVAQALYGHAFYLAKLVVPVSLGPLYDLPAQRAFVGRLVWVNLAVFVSLGALGVCLRHRFKLFMPAWGWYVIVLLPVSGILQSGSQMAADRYTYVSCMGWAVAAGALYGRVGPRGGTAARTVPFAGLAALVIVVLGALTWRQCSFWRDSTALWRRGVNVSPGSAVAHTNLGDALMRQPVPDPAAALESYQRALVLDPGDAKAHNGAATAALAMNRRDVGLYHLQRAVAIAPRHAFAHYNLGEVLAGGYGRFDDAITHYRRALERDPGFSEAASKLGDALIHRGRYAEAAEVLRSAVVAFPDDAYFHSTLAWLLATCVQADLRDGVEALAHATTACRLTGGRDPWALDSLAAALAETRRFAEAVAAARRARTAAQEQELTDLAAQIERRIRRYQSKRPFRMEM